MRKKVALIVNPASGTVSKHRIIPDVLRRLSRYGYDVELQATNGPGHATAIAVEIAENGSFDGVLVAGGDDMRGTVRCAGNPQVGGPECIYKGVLAQITGQKIDALPPGRQVSAPSSHPYRCSSAIWHWRPHICCHSIHFCAQLPGEFCLHHLAQVVLYRIYRQEYIQ